MSFLPKVSQSNRAIQYAIFTISYLHEHPSVRAWKQCIPDETPRNPVFGWYARSLSAFRSQLAKADDVVDYQLALLSCILFTNIEFQQNNVANACRLLQCGLSLIERANAEGENKLIGTNTAAKTVLEMFSRQRVLMALYGYPPPVSTNETFANWHHASWSSQDALTRARADLFRCLDDTVSLVRAARSNEPRASQCQHDETLHVQRQRALEALELWHHNFSRSGLAQAQSSPRPDAISMLLLTYYEIALIWIMTCLESEESATDRYMDRFARILNLTENFLQERQTPDSLSAHYSPELGIIAPLFMVGWKCRDRDLRRRALNLLRRGPEQEALYRADYHAMALQKIIEIEEEPAAMLIENAQCPERWVPPEAARIRNLTVHWETWEGTKVQPCLIFDMSADGVESPSNLVQQKVPL